MKTTTLPLRNLMHRSPLRALLLTPLLLACFALSPTARAVLPAPDGGYPNENTAEGDFALLVLTTGFGNTAVGFEALFSNTGGSFNTANGGEALFSNTTGNYNTATGHDALSSNTSGFSNTATSSSALFNLTTGHSNTAIGGNALESNKFGSSNIAVGAFAGANIKGRNNLDIGNRGKENDSNTIRIGTTSLQNSTFIAGISGVTVADGGGVIVDTHGHLGTVVSSKRYKDSIQQMDKASAAILSLKPVKFRYKKELDPDGIPQFGLVAEQVEKVNPDLVARDGQGKPYTGAYEAGNPMLLNEFLQ